ncbi:MAG: hypothetical protein AB7O96_14510 [Pseudobdellovibrionaceae bacterium]
MKLFFRNDDVGWNLKDFEKLLGLFVKNGQKLNGAAIPSASMDAYKKDVFNAHRGNLQIHTHGYAHLDHQSEGKKAEFGSARSHDSVKKELRESLSMTQDVFKDLFFPAFTPPWNRIDETLIPLLAEAGFKVLSRDGDKISKTPGLKDLNIDLDLHTSKKPRIYTTESLLAEAEEVGKTKKHVGIMIHHKHMVEDDFVFMDQFLKLLSSKKIETHFFSELEKDL